MDQIARSIEYINCISADGLDSPKKYPGYVNKKSNGGVSVMLGLWEWQSIPLMPSLPRPLWDGVVAPNRVLSMCTYGELNSFEIELFMCIKMDLAYVYKNGFVICV